MNEHLRIRLDAILSQLQAAHAGGDAMSYSTRGTERETFVDLLLRGCLPGPYRFGSGEVTDAHGNRSGQIDLVIEHPFFPSFPLLGTSQQRLYLIESVAIAIEVKSSKAQFSEAVSTMERFRVLDADADWSAPGIKRAQKDRRAPLASGPRGLGYHTSFPGETAFAMVFFEGWANEKALRKHCDEHEVDVALQLMPPLLYARKYRDPAGLREGLNRRVFKGSAALAAFLCIVSDELRALSHWESDVYRRYVEQRPAYAKQAREEREFADAHRARDARES